MINDNAQHTRGIAIYDRNEPVAEEVQITGDFIDCVWCKIKLSGGGTLLTGCVNKSPSSSEENLTNLKNMIVAAAQGKDFTHLLIMGDFLYYPNINWTTWSSSGDKDGEKFIEVIRDCYLHQRVDKNTRARIGCEPSVLDLIFTNEVEMVEGITYCDPLGHSDHCALDFTFLCYNLRRKIPTRDGISIKATTIRYQMN
ncbi:hypothetical protein FSP39_023862 [Pinctada imbricata]|uniref:Endonuclease/exonuclease/phosphatase domain-containing protein n=1 Tax=Pinctada imbricata TaxID=66713 RepID=A0AA88Y0R9_PINIB|nr:hypothetical protein FSP39_023862 [Pinctada imbricata]